MGESHSRGTVQFKTPLLKCLLKSAISLLVHYCNMRSQILLWEQHRPEIPELVIRKFNETTLEH